MNDLLLQFFTGGFEAIFNPLTKKIETLTTTAINNFTILINLIMTIQEQQTKLSAELVNLETSIKEEQKEVSDAVNKLIAQSTELTAQVTALNNVSLEPQVAAVTQAIADVKAIFVPAVLPVTEDNTSVTPVTPVVPVVDTVPTTGSTGSSENTVAQVNVPGA